MKLARKTRAKIRERQVSSVRWEAMEPRLLLSADTLAGAGLDAGSSSLQAGPDLRFDDADAIATALQSLSSTEFSAEVNPGVPAAIDLGVFALDDREQDETPAAATFPISNDQRTEVLIVDTRVADYQQLIDGILTGQGEVRYEILILDPGQNGLDQIGAQLAERNDVDALHIISHGREGQLLLGSEWLGAESLADKSAELSHWREALAENADVLLYGCNLATDSAGQHFISSLARFTDADVAASDDLTGASELGGDWDLEYQTGAIEAGIAISPLLQQNWDAVLATFTVDSNSDTVDNNPGDGLARDISGNTTLRAAIMESNALGGSHTILLGADTYTLSIGGASEDAAATGDLDIRATITITGTDSASSIIDAAGLDRVFHVSNGNSLAMTDLTVQGGHASGGGQDDRGGGIYAEQNTMLKLDRVVLQNNVADLEGGGIYTRGSSAGLLDVTIQNNGDAGTNRGGGIFNAGQATTLDRVTISGNQAGSGGGISNEGEILGLRNVTLSGNSAASNGGAIENVVDGASVPGTLIIVNSTFSGNTATTGNGIYQDAFSGLGVQNSIFDDGGSNISGGAVISTGNNIDSDGSAGLGGPGNQVGNPMLDILADNGGFTRTHALLSGSIAVDAGSSIAAPPADQRGQVRLGAVDVGAYEFTDYGLIWGDVATDTISVATLDGNHVTDLISGLDNPASVAIDPAAGKVYWSNEGDGKIQRANLDGAGVEDIVTGLSGPIAIDLYLSGGKIYWTDGGGSLSRANLDGTSQEGITGSVSLSTGVAVDGSGSMVYWVDEGVGRIRETGLTGAGTANLVNSNVNNTADIALDLVNDKVYWTNTVTGELWRAVLSDGSGVESLNVGGTPYGLALDPLGNKTYWMDSAAGELHRVNLSDGSGHITLYTGLADPRDVDLFSITSVVPSPPVDDVTLMLSTNGVALDDNAATFNRNDIAVFSNPDMSFELGDGTTGITDGTFSAKYTLPDNVRAIHYVGTAVTVDTVVGGVQGTYDLQVGQVVLSMRTSNTLPAVGGGTITVDNTDLLVYSPLSGEYEILLEGAIFGSDGFTPANIHAISIVEQDTLVGVDTTLSAGTYVLASSDPAIHADISTYNNTNGRQDLLLGADFMSDPGKQVQGLEFLEATVSVNGATLNQGTLLLTFTTADSTPITIGTGGGTTVSANQTDIVALTMNATEQDSVSLTNVDAQIFFDGSDISLSIDDSGSEGEINGLALVVDLPAAGNSVPSATNLNQALAYNEGDASVAINDIVVSDADSGELITATLTLVDTSTGSLSATDGATFNGGTGVWTITDTVANVNTALANLEFNPTPNNETDTTISVNIDDGDEDSSGPLTGIITLDVTPAYYLDQFNATSYSGDDGSLSWSNDWQEIGEADGAAPGNVSVWNNLGETGLLLWSSDGIGAWREADLSGAASATLSFDWAMFKTETGDTVTLEISTDGGLSWVTLDTYVGPLDHSSMQTASYDISAHIDNDTRIKFETTTGFAANDEFFIDNVRIDIDSGPSAINNAPTATNLSSTSAYNEGDAVVPITDIVVTDADVGDIITATLTLADTGTGSLSTNDGATYNGGTGVWAITDTVANVNTALANLVFNPALNNEVDTTIGVNIDDGDEDLGGALSGTITLDVTPANDAPTATNMSQGWLYNEDTLPLNLTNIVVTDPDSGETITATLTLANIATGSLSANDGATYDGGTGVWTITDTVANVNTALANVIFSPSPNNDVNTTLTVHIEDAAATGPADSVINLDVTPANDAPTATNLNQALAYNEGDATVVINNIVITEVDTVDTITATLTLLDTSTGSISANDGASYNGGTGVWTITDTVANVNTALANVVFNPNANNEVDTSITTHIEDAAGTGPTDGLIDLTVTPANDAPTASNLNQALTYNEGDAGVDLNDIVVVDADSGETITATLTLADMGTGSLSANDGASYNSGTGVWTITDTVANVNTALSNVVFNPNSDSDIDTSITTHIEDAAGTGPADGLIDLTVTPANDAPTASNLNQALAYNEGDAGVDLNDIVVVDADSGEMITATLTLADTSAGSLSANNGASYNGGTGVWTITDTVANVNTALANVVFNPNANNDVDTTITTHIEDAAGTGPVDGLIDLTVTPANDAPTASNLNQALTYNEGDAGVDLNDIVVVDADSGETITATLTLADMGTGSLSANDGASYNNGTGVWTITDTVANVNTALANVVFNPNADNDVDTTITTHIEDAAGTGPTDGLIDLVVTAANDAPTASNLNQALAYNEGDASVDLNDIVVVDADSGETITATLTLADTGTGSLSANDGASYNSGTGVWTITDTVANVNTALANVVFNPNADNDVDTTITAHIEDAAGAGPADGRIDLQVLESELISAVEAESEALPVEDPEPSDAVEVEEAAPPAENTDSEAEALIEASVTESAEEETGLVPFGGTPPVNLLLDQEAEPTDYYGLRNFSGYEPRQDQYDVKVSQQVTVQQQVWSTLVSMDTTQANLAALHASSGFSQSLDDLREDVGAQREWGRAMVGSSIAVSSGISIGYVAWLIRSGVILSTVLSSMPAWRFIDPTPILSSMVAFDEEEDQESLESIVASGEEVNPDDSDSDEDLSEPGGLAP